MDRRAHRPFGWQAIVILGLCFTAASVYGLGSGRARLRVVPARATDRAFLVRSWGELRRVTELPTLLIEPRPFVMEPRPVPVCGPDPRAWGISVARTRSEPPSTREASLGSPAVMASTPPPALPEPTSSLPADVPDPARVRSVVASFRARAERCYEATMVSGRVALWLTVEGATGAVRSARAEGESPTARCIESAAGSLRFPTFARDTISIQQTYAFR
jgi:hypothetical protein